MESLSNTVESTSVIRSLLAAAPDAMIVVDCSGQIVLANTVAEMVFGYTTGELANKHLEILIPPEVRPRHGAHFKEFIKKPTLRQMGKGMGLEGYRKGGARFSAEISLSSLRTQDQLLFVAAVRDITDRKAIEMQLQEKTIELTRSNQELELFAYVASHDLQEPLRTIVSYSQLLERRYPKTLDQDAQDFLNFIVDGASRMQDLINNLLDYSRVTLKGKAFTSVSTQMVVESIFQSLELAIQDKDARIVCADLPDVCGDEFQLRQLFQNLICNALKFSVKGCVTINIGYELAQEEIIFFIQDSGIGISPIYHERIFQVFQRLNGLEDYPGTGIGLAICKKIVDRHGGRIWVESKEGEGAIFRFSIPTIPK